MKAHTKIYLDYFSFDTSDFIPCEICGITANDIHHISSRKMGGQKGKDTIDNLMAVCRRCHQHYGDKKQFVEMLNSVHQTYMAKAVKPETISRWINMAFSQPISKAQ